MKIWIISILFFGFSGILMAQQFPMQHFTKEHGLSHSNVFRIFQDSKGFIWFCTDNGVSRFNGKSFENYYEQTSRLSNVIMSMSEGDDGQMYFASYGGGIQLLKDTVLQTLQFRNKQLPLCWAYTLPVGKLLWGLALQSKQDFFLLKNDSLQAVKVSNNPDFRTKKIVNELGEILLTSNEGIYKIDGEEIYPLMSDLISKKPVYDVKKVSDNNYWIALDKEIVHVKDRKIVQRFALPAESKVSDLLLDKRGDLWVAVSNAGIYCIRKGSMQDMTTLLQLGKIVVNDIFEDNSGHIWIATHGQGVYRVRDLNTIYFPVMPSILNVYANVITKFDDSSVIVGSMGAVSVWKNDKLKPLFTHPLLLLENVYDIAANATNVWVGTTRFLFNYNRHTGNVNQLLPKGNKVFGAIALHKSHQADEIVFGNFSNAWRLRNDSVFTPWLNGLLKGKRVNTLLDVADGRAYLGTDSGLITIMHNEIRYVDLPGVFNKCSINKLLSDSYGRIWIASNAGLFYIQDNQVRRFRINNEPECNAYRNLYIDDGDSLWFSSMQGLNCIALSTLKVVEDNAYAYLDEIRSVCRLNNRLFVGTINGLYVINTDNSVNANQYFPLYVTKVTTVSDKILMPKTISIKYKQKIRIEYIALNYDNAVTMQYRYRVQGIDKGWTYTQNNEVELSALPPGNYHFQISASTNSKLWSAVVTIPVEVQTPFYKARWFIALAILCIGTTIAAFVRFVTLRRVRKKAEELSIYNRIVFLKQQALTALINPHFIFNCMNSIQHYLNRKDLAAANKYLGDFAKLIRHTLEDARSSFILLDKEILRIELYLLLEQLRFGEGLSFKIEVDDDLLNNSVFIPNMILQPYIENAIWHGIMPKDECGHIFIRFQLLSNTKEVQIVIEDDGVGFGQTEDIKAHAAHESMGMMLTEGRLNLLNKLLKKQYRVSKFNVFNEQGMVMGAKVIIIIPMNISAEDIKRTGDENVY